MEDRISDKIATTSIGEGLDFACNLVSSCLSELAQLRPEQTKELLDTLASYIGFRYVGEEGLALEYLTHLGKDVSIVPSFQRQQFGAQLAWVAKKMGLSAKEYEEFL